MQEQFSNGVSTLGLPVSSIPRPGESFLCAGHLKSGDKCSSRASQFIGDTGFCARHTPLENRGKTTDRPQSELDALREQYRQSGRTILTTYKQTQVLRQVPPPEKFAFYFLRAIQQDRCFLCIGNGNPFPAELGRNHLVEDHDHESGMVRALLCRACNTSEGLSQNLLLKYYRRFSPAKGWHYRYNGRGEQWEVGQPDPVQNRVSCEDSGLTEIDCAKNPTEALNHYLKFARWKVENGYSLMVRSWKFDAWGRIEWKK